jgi:hypothetical protein
MTDSRSEFQKALDELIESQVRLVTDTRYMGMYEAARAKLENLFSAQAESAERLRGEVNHLCRELDRLEIIKDEYRAEADRLRKRLREVESHGN